MALADLKIICFQSSNQFKLSYLVLAVVTENSGCMLLDIAVENQNEVSALFVKIWPFETRLNIFYTIVIMGLVLSAS